ncbi:MAG: heparinase II/III family protein [Verrucomicrobiota bacterium JB024]|nr:heparinase II/III family protein [Verrucomicrobiota bacterium JB024]
MIRNYPYQMAALACALILLGNPGCRADISTMDTAPVSRNGAIVGSWWGSQPEAADSGSSVLRFTPEVPYGESLVLCIGLTVDTDLSNPPSQLALEVTTQDGKSATVKAPLETGPNWLAIPLKTLAVAGGGKLGKGDVLTQVCFGDDGAPLRAVRISQVVLLDNKYVAANPPPMSAARNELAAGELHLLNGVAGEHPRLIVSGSDLEAVREYYQAHPGEFRELLPKRNGDEVHYFQAAPASLTNPQTATGIFAKLAAAYAVTEQPQYLDALMQAVPYLEDFQPVIIQRLYDNADDLIAGDVLVYLSLAYDLLEADAPEPLVQALRTALIRQTIQTYVDLLNVDRYAYMQNHFFTPVAGLLTAACTLAGELPEAEMCAVWSLNVLRRVKASLPQDAWCFESVSYWGYQRYLFIASEALEKTYGEELVSPEDYQQEAAYLAHIFLPDPDFAFDFGDAGPRVEAGDGFQEGYDWPWHTYPTHILKTSVLLLNHRADSATSRQMVRSLIADQPVTRRMDTIFGLLLNQPRLLEEFAQSEVIPEEKPYRYFSDMEVVHWRGSWDDPEATALAFKSGPPAGHHMADFLKQHPHASSNFSHAHPDAGSFVLFAHGAFLANDTAYLGKKETAHHNSILVDGVGQKKGGTPWYTFEEPYEAYEDIRLEDVWLDSQIAAATAIFDTAYDEAFQLTELKRELVLVAGRFLVVADTMSADIPHVYEWRWHSDTAAEEVEPGEFEIVNGPARLSLRLLSAVDETVVEPTIVETELYSPTHSRPQQRGYHLAQRSAAVPSNTFLNAARIGSAEDDPGVFLAIELAPGKIELTDDRYTCIVWLSESSELDGQYAYLLSDHEGYPLAAGLSGVALNAEELQIQNVVPGQVTFTSGADHALNLGTAQPESNRNSVLTQKEPTGVSR